VTSIKNLLMKTNSRQRFEALPSYRKGMASRLPVKISRVGNLRDRHRLRGTGW